MLNEITPASIKIFHIGSISLIDGEDADIWEQRFGELAEQGVVTSLDPNIRQLLIKNQSEYLSRLKRMIKYAHILKLSDEDLKYIYSEKSVDDAFDEICRGTDAKIVVLTMGEKGARVKTGEFSFEVNAVVCDHIVDTVGAGDTFMGTVLAEINDKNISVAAISGINESELKRIIERASEAAALNCQTAGCNPPYKNDF